MIISNALIKGELYSIVIENGIITDISEKPLQGDIDACGHAVIPGLIDVHSHGCVGLDTMDGNFEPMCRFLAQNGTTSWLPTTMTEPVPILKELSEKKTDFKGTQILGFHLEGPYISEEYRGAQNPDYITSPSFEEISGVKNVKMITVAPEIDGCMEFIEKISKNVVVSLGHTACGYDTAAEAIDCGATCLTHVFNAMKGIHHRDTGCIGAAFEKNVYVQLICDGLHVSKSAVLMLYKLFGDDRIVLISDSIRSAGCPDGCYDSGGMTVILKDGVARLSDGTLAGSSSTLLQCVKTAVSFGIPFDSAVKMATETPAALIKDTHKGRIAIGYDADLLLVDENLDLQKVIIKGQLFE